MEEQKIESKSTQNQSTPDVPNEESPDVPKEPSPDKTDLTPSVMSSVKSLGKLLGELVLVLVSVSLVIGFDTMAQYIEILLSWIAQLRMFVLGFMCGLLFGLWLSRYMDGKDLPLKKDRISVKKD